MHQLSHNFFPKKRVLPKIKNFLSIKTSTSENADERVIVKNSSPPPTVGQLSANSLPTVGRH